MPARDRGAVGRARVRQREQAAAGGHASTAGYYSTSTAFLEALAEAGVSYVFANLGSDHPGLIEAYAQAKADGREDAYPRLIVCPHEMVALSAAHAYASVSRQPQAVVVHVDGGTQNLGGE
ncbi:MAG TPA: thiamine pyrophosphate-binding protein, partial [Acidimicrobiales bacterium]|nr:thiamine pyrophosphate-binding protein [Acidimicrobiales bacterium]